MLRCAEQLSGRCRLEHDAILSQHDDVGAGRLVVAVGADDARVEPFDGRRFPLVEPLALRDPFDDVDEDDIRKKVSLVDGQILTQDDRTRIVSLSWVGFASGWRTAWSRWRRTPRSTSSSTPQAQWRQ